MTELAQDIRRQRLRSLIKNDFAGDNDLVARALQEVSGKKVSERTIQAWLIAPNRTSSRNCPEWALKMLQDYVTDPERSQKLHRFVELRTRTEDSLSRHPLAHSEMVRTQSAVELATSAIEADARRLLFWQELLGLQAGRALFELESKKNAELRPLRVRSLILDQVLASKPKTIEELQVSYRERVEADEIARFHIDEARRAIEGKTDEFSSDEGVPSD